MKTVVVDGQNIVTFLGRGLGDSGLAIRYAIEEGDGTYSEVGVWYNDPPTAQKAYDALDEEHLRWVVKEARRQTVQVELREAQDPYVVPEVVKLPNVTTTLKQ